MIRDQLGFVVWGLRMVQSADMTVGQALVGLSSDVTFWIREGPQLFVDPFTASKSNITTVIVEERGAAAVTRPDHVGGGGPPKPVGPGPGSGRGATTSTYGPSRRPPGRGSPRGRVLARRCARRSCRR